MKTPSKLAIALISLLASASLTLAAPDLDKMFASQDTDGDGVISLEELTDARTDWIKSNAKKKGFSEEEVAARIEKMKTGSAQRFAKKDDANGDGVLSKEEWLKMRKRNTKK